MKSRVTREMLNNEDFWEFHIDRLKSGFNKFEDSVTLYHRQYYQKKAKYKARQANSISGERI